MTLLKGLIQESNIIAEEKTEGKLDNSTVFGNGTNLDISGDLISQDIRSTLNLQQDLAAGLRMNSGPNKATYLKDMQDFNN